MTQTLEIFGQAITKNDIPEIVSNLVDNVLENGNPLEVAEKIKVMEEIIEGVKKDKRYKDYALDEIAKYGKEGYVSPNGVKIEQMTAGGKYDFSKCEDIVWQELNFKLQSITEQLKAREAFLKTLPPFGLVVTDQETGETNTIYPPAPPAQTTTYKITLSKK